jgi:hypothetical protein
MKMRTMLLAFTASIGVLTAANAADVAPATKAPTYVAPQACQSAGNCSGGYGYFAVENNADISGTLTGGATSGLGIDIGAGYQLWKGSWFAGIEGGMGYQFGTGGADGTITSTQFVKLGYNFFSSTTPSASATPATSQNPFLGLVPANIIANSTPAVIMGGCYGHGIEKGCGGLEIDSVIAAGWSAAFQYYNAPSVKGQADENVFRIMVQKHFNTF